MRILLVDDERQCLEGLQIALQPAGYECITTTDPFVALELYRENPFDVVIADLKMPGLSGFELLDKLKVVDSQVRLILITAYCTEETGYEALQHQACGFFCKPLIFKDFIRTLRRLEECALALKYESELDERRGIK